ncbi:MAG: endonuclease/exonuclease/phosphatase family protein [Cyanobacteria bacterium P01_E01_bin.35]
MTNANAVAIAEPLKIAAWNIENLTVGADKDYVFLQDYVKDLEADVIALQEVDGARAAEQVFDPDDYDFYFSNRNNRQRTGFAVRKGIDVVQNPDYDALNVSGGLRYGTDITVSTDDKQIRLLSIHLKSGCFTKALEGLGSGRGACDKLSRQVPILEDWIDDRASEEIPFAVMGDFNRRLNIADDDLWDEIDDGVPANADLTKVTEGRLSDCFDGKFPQYIDHIVLDKQSTDWLVPGSFEQKLYDQPLSREDFLSDHCAIAVTLEMPGTFPASDFGGMGSSNRNLGTNRNNGNSPEAIFDRISEMEIELRDLRRLIESFVN